MDCFPVADLLNHKWAREKLVQLSFPRLQEAIHAALSYSSAFKAFDASIQSIC